MSIGTIRIIAPAVSFLAFFATAQCFAQSVKTLSGPDVMEVFSQDNTNIGRMEAIQVLAFADGAGGSAKVDYQFGNGGRGHAYSAVTVTLYDDGGRLLESIDVPLPSVCVGGLNPGVMTHALDGNYNIVTHYAIQQTSTPSDNLGGC